MPIRMGRVSAIPNNMAFEKSVLPKNSERSRKVVPKYLFSAFKLLGYNFAKISSGGVKYVNLMKNEILHQRRK